VTLSRCEEDAMMVQNKMPLLNKQLERFHPSAINTGFTLAGRLEADGVDIVNHEM
jgi:hypothetical protein